MEWEEIERVALIVAHPDDIEYGSAGTAARLSADGKSVHYVIATDGSMGSADPEMTPQRLSAIRKEEQCEAARIAGAADVSFLDFPDSLLEPNLDLRKAITAVIRKCRPDVVICQNPVRELTTVVFAQHPDHLATGEATFAAVYPAARDRMTFPDLLAAGLEPWPVKEMWVSGTSKPDHFVDITSTLDIKIRALKAHVSQVDPERIDTMVPDRARQLGQPHDMDYAEGYLRIVIP